VECGNERRETDAGRGDAVQCTEKRRRRQPGDERRRVGEPRDAVEHRSDHARHHGDRRNAEIDLAAEQNEGDAGRHDGEGRHLRKDVAQVDEVQEAVGRRAEEHDQEHERREGGEISRAGFHPRDHSGQGFFTFSRRYDLVHLVPLMRSS
jgi:hypothetical protein